MWKTGHSLIKAKMAETGAPLAGEMSGHIFFADGFYGFDDALYAARPPARHPGRAARDAWPSCATRCRQLVNTPELRFDCPEERKFAVVEEVKARLAGGRRRGQRHRRRAGADRRTAGGCCAPPTPRPCWWRAARRADEAGLERLKASSRPRCGRAASPCPDDAPPAGITDARFFFYGTLLDRDVMALVLGRRLPPSAFAPAILSGHSRRRAREPPFRSFVPIRATRCEGMVVGGLTASDVARLSAYEGPGYRVAAEGLDRRQADHGLGVRAGGGPAAAERSPWDYALGGAGTSGPSLRVAPRAQRAAGGGGGGRWACSRR